ncbi:hypothetical protein ACWT_7155 [Actinoplanes sp. SE50]|uniref:outer membrane protein assembly factor BamB family protein n=1 Tax=unclassified Actinoplanes TaxID=2626549 RepID=UPI00023EDE41|nr:MULTISPECIES: PQQ-binding-like beta-propeller repeat protein [unclassified Actinoplanes]AEV88165.1 hypothetical protein ACPL_7285 [Actinoplanes sp. SE50/110]ATO86570.1 hypothetical protein ACWT_7155 [Actinoplanes sp. SE50]SLM03987.1 hypothetical protein ACSP50_7286 [Actinoplanes sp. SE50/110]
MSTDLDELFTTLGRQADAVPIGTAEQARRRGAQLRTRQRAVLAGAAAVVLVLAGAGVLAVRQHRLTDPVLPATTPSRIRGLAPLGEPLPAPAGETWTAARIAGDRVIGLSKTRAIAIDAGTGRTLWTLPGLDSTYLGVATTAKSVILVRQPAPAVEDIKAPDNRVLEFHDPATGAKRWQLPHTTGDRLVLHRDVVVRLSKTTGRIDAYDLAGGRRLWTAAAGATMISGMLTGADASEDVSGGGAALFSPESEKAFPVTDDRLVSITSGGQVVIRNIRTGKVQSQTRARRDAQELIAYEGMVYTEESTPGGLGIGTPQRILYDRQGSWAMDRYFPCGHDRLCLYETDGSDVRLLLIDAVGGTVLRRTGAVPLSGTSSVRLGHVMTSGGGDKGTALYDENGQARYSDNGIGGFIDDGNVLTLTRDAGDGRFTARGVSNIDYRKVTLGTMPEISGRCDWDTGLLTCPTGQGLYSWRFTR